MAERKSLSKRVRFAVFARDNFTCRYCGRQSDSVVLVIDHMIPVSAGGTNDAENLVTACETCNQGKADTTLSQHAPNDSDRLRLLQEQHEQLRVAKAAQQIAEARRLMEQTIVDYWCEARGQAEMQPNVAKLMTNWALRYGAEVVFTWIDLAVGAMNPWHADYRVAKYISGIRRNWIAAGRIPGDV